MSDVPAGLLNAIYPLRTGRYVGMICSGNGCMSKCHAHDERLVERFTTGLLAELSESPLPGARYAYEVIQRRLAEFVRCEWDDVAAILPPLCTHSGDAMTSNDDWIVCTRCNTRWPNSPEPQP